MFQKTPVHDILRQIKTKKWRYNNCIRILLSVKMFFFLYLICFPALQTVDADKVYVLGGLVDESIQKVGVKLLQFILNHMKMLCTEH